jgi:hypothetical protein
MPELGHARRYDGVGGMAAVHSIAEEAALMESRSRRVIFLSEVCQ